MIGILQTAKFENQTEKYEIQNSSLKDFSDKNIYRQQSKW